VATLAEAEMVAQAGGRDILLAYQPVGPNLQRLSRLVRLFPQASFATVVDDVAVLHKIAAELGDLDQPFRVFIDVDCGMHRTGIELGDSLAQLRDQVEAVPGILYQGLHVYDGHIHDADFEVRRQRSQAVIAVVSEYQRTNPSPVIIGGGSPTFSFWAQSPWECSPGTPVFWDRGYSGGYPELPFKTAVVLITRIISRPVQDRLCLDLGYKSVAAEMPLDIRLFLPQIPEAKFVGHSEEHLVIETPRAKDFAVGEILLAYPKHICPTVALHAFATVVRNQEVTHEIWRVTARDR
jgi:D-serine deaminase-like pyridoxal phosphate-dependent protein